MNTTVDRAVIEQALKALNYVRRHGPAVQKAKDLLQDALEQPEQEPVAHQDTADKCLLETVPAKGTLFHTAPLQCKPLSDDEIQAIWKKTFESGSSPNTFARAIEAAHNIKE